ncbi:MAG: response regulator [Magnetococcales bacterium]|nr:response regulator [Magnetococcales bacterium]
MGSSVRQGGDFHLLLVSTHPAARDALRRSLGGDAGVILHHRDLPGEAITAAQELEVDAVLLDGGPLDGSDRYRRDWAHALAEKLGIPVLSLGREAGAEALARELIGANHRRRERLRHLERMAAVCRKGLIRATHQQHPLDLFARHLAETGEFPLVWIGRRAGGAEGIVRRIAGAGGLNHVWGEVSSRDPSHPVTMALRQGRSHWIGDLEQEGGDRTWARALVAGGCRSLALFPFAVERDSQGVLAVGSPALLAFAAAERELLEELAEDLACALRAADQMQRNRRIHQTRTVIDSLLRTALEPHSLEEQLSIALERILSVHWLALESRGAIFLADADGDLTLTVQRGLAENLLTRCARVAVGYCLCGRAAASRAIVHAGEVDERHEVTHPDLHPHGHYCVPIVSQDRLLGVITLYLAAGHPRDPAEEEFLLAIANTLAGLILRVRSDEALQQAKARAEAASRAKTHFLANVSHEIRTPLNAIVGFAQILLKHRREIPTRLVRHLENIRLSGDNLAEIISNVLDLSKIEAGKFRLEEESVDLKLLIQSLYQVLKPRAEAKQVEFQYQVDATLPRSLRLDRTRVNQVLTNLLDNAIKFTPPGRRITLRAAVRDDRVLLLVADQGKGIPAHRQTEIFAPFEQGDAATTREFGGTGLGLAIVKSLVEMMQGTIQLESQPGQGATFTVALPLVTMSAQPGQRSDAWETIRFSGLPRVLLVEDNPINRQMLLSLLEETGLVLDVAENGQDGVERARRFNPDLILMDLHMPVMDGFTASREIRRLGRLQEVPIIGFSADALVERRQQAQAAGITDFLTKPVDLGQLMALLARYLTVADRPTDGPAPAPSDRPPLPEEVRAVLLDGLKEIAAMPPFLSRQIVQRCDDLARLSAPFTSPFDQDLERIRDAVYTRRSGTIPALVREALLRDRGQGGSPVIGQGHGCSSHDDS